MALSMFHELKKYSTWTEVSLDDTSGISMVESNAPIINFDHVKTGYLNALGKTEECAASVDALGESLASDNKDYFYFIEFKNGEIDAENIRNKVAESLLMFNDITHKEIKETRENAEFILVYNPQKKQYRPQEQRAIHLSRIGKAPCPFYGLGKYQGTYFKRAYMMSAELFAKEMIRQIGIR